MASESGAVWAIDIGNNSLKALHLSNESGSAEVIGFDNIQHSKILTGGVTSAERDELIAISLRQFVKQNNLGKDSIVVSVPSQNSFARFVSLPPVAPKRIPEIVRFEAVQQIPFDINDVQWDWQLMTEAGKAETKVGIFAIKNDVVSSVLEHFSRENIQVNFVQMAAMALYNYVYYDRNDMTGTAGSKQEQAIVVLDIGAENTDLVVCTKSGVWQRCILMGGNSFTRAIADAFKLDFQKAEKLKRTAPVSKYARQIFQAMKPVFTDLSSEIQRSLGFYNSSNPNTKLSKIIAFGGGTKMRGLLKYLQQSLQIPVERPDSFKKLAIREGVSEAKFHENVCDFGAVYGLALQGLGLAKIKSNLLPRSIARSMAWASKAKYLVVAACALLLVSLMCFVRTNLDRVNYTNNERLRQKVGSVINVAKQASSKLKAQKSKAADYEAIIQKAFEPFKYRDVIPLLYQTIISAMPNEKNNPEQKELYRAFANSDVATVLKTPRKERKQIFVTSMSVRFVDDITTAKLDDTNLLKTSGRGGKGRTRPYGGPEARRTARHPTYSPGRARKDDTAKRKDDENRAGFVVTIAGYSPYGAIGELMEPVGVEDSQNKWGFITRLMHPERDPAHEKGRAGTQTIADGNSPFEVYGKTRIEHFKLEINQVGLEAEMPTGIGIEKSRKEKEVRRRKKETIERVLIDPMTKEIISKVPDLDEQGRKKLDRSGNVVYKVNDNWFVLKAKFIWKDAPEIE